MSMTLTKQHYSCIAWGKKSPTAASEMYECFCKKPSDMDTIHISDSSGQHTLCHCFVYRVLPYVRTLGNDAKVCRRCQELERVILRDARRKERMVVQ